MYPIVKQPTASVRILIATWMLASLILANVYSSIVYSILTIPEYNPAIDTVQDLVRAATYDTHYVTLKDMTFSHAMTMSAKPSDHSIFYILKQHIIRTNGKFMHDIKWFIRLLEGNPKLVIIGLKISSVSRRYLWASKDLHVSSEALATVYLSWALRKRSPLLQPFNRV